MESFNRIVGENDPPLEPEGIPCRKIGEENRQEGRHQKGREKNRRQKEGKKAVKRAGRPKGSGEFGCATTAVRIPIRLKDEVRAFVQKKIKAEGKG